MTVLAQDDFTDMGGTSITAHTMPIGPGWSVRKGDFKIANGALTVVNPEDDDGISIPIDVENYVLACTCTSEYLDAYHLVSADLEFAIKDVNNNWLVQNFAPSDSLFVYQKIDGSYYLRTSGKTPPNPSGSSHEIKIVVQDGKAFLYFDDSFVLSVESDDFKQPLAVGVRASQIGVFAGTATWDDFSVMDNSPILGSFVRYRFTG